MTTFAETYNRIKKATQSIFGRRNKHREPGFRELTAEEQRAIADKWLSLILKSYITKAAGEPYNGQRWEKRVPTKSEDGHLLLIKTGKLYDAVKNSTVTVYRGKKGVLEFHAEVASKPYRRKGQQVTTRDVFLVHQCGTPTCPARPIFVELSPKDQKELDNFVKVFLENTLEDGK